jgi:hypothetical protein
MRWRVTIRLHALDPLMNYHAGAFTDGSYDRPNNVPRRFQKSAVNGEELNDPSLSLALWHSLK